MEGGFPFGGMFGGGDPDEIQRALSGMAEQMQQGQKVAFADNAINLAVQMTIACINRLDLSGTPVGSVTGSHAGLVGGDEAAVWGKREGSPTVPWQPHCPPLLPRGRVPQV